MKITLNNEVFETLRITDEPLKTIIYLGESVDVDTLVRLFKGEVTMSVIDDDEEYKITATYLGASYIETQGNKYVEAYKKKTPTPDTIAELNEQITNLELAICEIYESLGV